MIKFLSVYLLLAGVVLSTDNLLKNPEFSNAGSESKVDGWRLHKDYCQVSDKTLKITLKSGQTLRLLSDVVDIDQQDRTPIEFGLEYKGSCKTKGWEHCVVLSDLTYQDGSKEAGQR